MLDVLQRVSPGLVDSLLLLIGFQFQKTDEPKSEDAPNNLYGAIEGYNTSEGDFGKLSIPAVTDWIEKNPTFKWGAIAAAAVGVAALFGGIGGDNA